MDIEEINFETLFGIAVKSEIESRNVYEYMAEKTKNYLLKDRLKFLANEEKKHEEFLRNYFSKMFPNKELKLPQESPVPLPHIEYDADTPISSILEQSMKAELAARDYYLSMSKKAEKMGDIELAKGLYYLANMEMGHYHILENELESEKRFEDYDAYWPMMHVGP